MYSKIMDYYIVSVYLIGVQADTLQFVFDCVSMFGLGCGFTNKKLVLFYRF